ncbi:right-handed parallel beta-helix repeat-containing protein [Candidatus Woesearchaeota archaeon]|nr:right-handed parallel beta-helix repeat-containing protein [Candidatus Woesearchaeota archaeon]
MCSLKIAMQNQLDESVRLYWVKDNGREEVGYDGYDTNDDDLVDYIEWIIPSLSNQTYEVEIAILNPVEVVAVGDNWTVMFNTTGTADLKISAINGTTWSNVNEDYDLKFLELMCGEDILSYNWIDDVVSVNDYNCNDTGYAVNKRLNLNDVFLEFDYGGNKGYATDPAVSCEDTIIASSTLTGNLTCTGTGINIGADDVVLDCSGYTINYSTAGNGGYAINNTAGYDNVTIQNCNLVEGHSTGSNQKAIYFKNVDNSLINNNNITTISFGSPSAITLENSSNNQITNNREDLIGITYDSEAILIDSYSNNNTIENNTINIKGWGSNYGIYIFSSSNNTIKNNSITNFESSTSPRSVIYITGSSSESNDIIGNTLTGRDKPTIYFIPDGSNISSNNNISNNIIVSTNYRGIHLTRTVNSTIKGNTIETNIQAFNINQNSTNNLIENNIFNSSDGSAIKIWTPSTQNNNFTNNTLISHSSYYDLDINSPGTDGNYFIDQPIGSYSIPGSGSILYFKDSIHGEIRFLEAINGSGNNLSADIKIENNSIYVNSSQTGLNQSANLSFFGVSITGFAIAFRNGEDCGDICGDLTNVSDTYYFNVSQFTKYSVGNRVNCGDTITSSTTLTTNLTCSGTGIIIGADDVVLDCSGYTINYSTSGTASTYGINNTGGYDNVTIQNCNVVEGNATGNNKNGVYFDNADNGTISNNNFTIFGAAHGISIDESDRNNITNNKFEGTGFGSGIELVGAEFNSILNNNILLDLLHPSAQGITLSEAGFQNKWNIISNNNLSVGGRGFWVARGRYNNFTNNTLDNGILSARSVILLQGASSNNRFEGNNITQGSTAIKIAWDGFTTVLLPHDNVFVNNTLSNILQVDFHLYGYPLGYSGKEINGTYFIDQPIGKYKITDTGGTFYIKDTGEGEIRFLEAINGSGDNLSADIKIGNNSIYVNSSKTGLNKSANLTFFGVSITGFATAFRNGEDCGDVCGDVTNVSDTYYFDVSQFTNYSVGDIVDCGDTITSSTTLIRNMTCSGTGIVIGADDVVLDCDGYTINYSTSEMGYGVSNTYNNVTVKNCNLVEGGSIWNNKHGIVYETISDNGTISNNNSSP